MERVRKKKFSTWAGKKCLKVYSFLKDDYRNSEKDNINIKIVKKNNEDFKIEAYVKNENNLVNSSELLKHFKNSNSIIKNQDLIFGSDNKINFTIDEKNKVKNLKVRSKLNLEKVIIDYKSSRLKKIFPNFFLSLFAIFKISFSCITN